MFMFPDLKFLSCCKGDGIKDSEITFSNDKVNAEHAIDESKQLFVNIFLDEVLSARKGIEKDVWRMSTGRTIGSGPRE